MKLQSALKYLVICTAIMSISSGQTFAKEVLAPKNVVAQSSAKKSSKQIERMVDFVEAEDPNVMSPFTGAEAELAELDNIAPLMENINKAIDVHNFLNSLPINRRMKKSYYEAQKMHNLALDALKESETCVVNYLGRYFKNPVSMWSGIDLRDNPNKHNLRKGLSAWAIDTFEHAKAAKGSQFDEKDITTLRADEITDESEKLREYSQSMQNDMVAINLVDKNPDSYNNDTSTAIEEELATNKDVVLDMREKYNDNFYKDPKRKDEDEKAAREIDLMTNDIGAEVAMNLSQNPQKWGSVKKDFPIWNDQKTFYNQYLDRKYENIIQYINNIEVAAEDKDLIYNALLKDKRLFMNKAEADITRAAMVAVTKTNNDYETVYNNLLKEYHDSIAIVEQNNKSKQASAENSQKTELSKIDKQIKKHKQTIKSLETEKELLSESIAELQQEFDNIRLRMLHYQKEILNASSEEKAEYLQYMQDLEAENKKLDQKKEAQDKIIKQISKISRDIEDLNYQKSQINNKYAVLIADINNLSDKQKLAVEEEFKQKEQQYAQSRETKIKQINIAAEAAKKVLDAKSDVSVKDIVNTTNLIVAVSKQDVIDNIKKVREQYQAMGDDLYRGANQAKVLAYHQALIDSLKGKSSEIDGLKLEGIGGKIRSISTELESIVSGPELEQNLNTLYVNLKDAYVKNSNATISVGLYDKVLEKVDTSADTEFFVGATPKERDFRAPKPMYNYNLPPMREYVRFDYVDLENAVGDAKKLTDYSAELRIPHIGAKLEGENIPLSIVEKNKFLNFGGRIPEIWKLMLQDKAFVETDFALSEALAPEKSELPLHSFLKGGEGAAVFSGGEFPCILRNTSQCGFDKDSGPVVNIGSYKDDKRNPYRFGYYLVGSEERKKLLKQNLPNCHGFKASCAGKKVYFSNDKGQNDFDLKAMSDKEYSELGTILNMHSGKIGNKTVKNILTLSPAMQSIYDYNLAMEKINQEGQEEELSFKDDVNREIYQYAQFTRNQIGDFLIQVENEETLQKSLNDIKKIVDENDQKLLESFKKLGFEPKEGFDIGKESDYKLAEEKLKNIKDKYSNATKQLLNGYKTHGSEELEVNKKFYERLYQALLKDKDALVILNQNSGSDEKLLEKIKTAQADNQAIDKYEQYADDAFKTILKYIEHPYCATY